MAQRTTVDLIDDIDGTKAAETISFAIDGAAYEIDLSRRNAMTMRKLVATYVDAGRPAGTVREIDHAARPASARSRPAAHRQATRKRPLKPKAEAAEIVSENAAMVETKTKAPSQRGPGSRRKADLAGPSYAEIRVWASTRDIKVPARGRISNAIREQYLAAQTP